MVSYIFMYQIHIYMLFPIAIIITLIFLTYFGVRFGIESRKRTEALNKLGINFSQRT